MPKSHVAPGARMPPSASPKTHTTSAQPALAAPPSRDQRPLGATRSQRPSPIWIQTADEAAWIGWLDQMLTPSFTRCCTHPGDVEADGSMTLVGSPSGIADWSWRSPSRIQRPPKPIRRMRRAAGSGPENARSGGERALTLLL